MIRTWYVIEFKSTWCNSYFAISTHKTKKEAENIIKEYKKQEKYTDMEDRRKYRLLKKEEKTTILQD